MNQKTKRLILRQLTTHIWVIVGPMGNYLSNEEMCFSERDAKIWASSWLNNYISNYILSVEMLEHCNDKF